MSRLYTWPGHDEAIDGPEAPRNAAEAFDTSVNTMATDALRAVFATLTESQQERALQALGWTPAEPRRYPLASAQPRTPPWLAPISPPAPLPAGVVMRDGMAYGPVSLQAAIEDGARFVWFFSLTTRERVAFNAHHGAATLDEWRRAIDAGRGAP